MPALAVSTAGGNQAGLGLLVRSRKRAVGSATVLATATQMEAIYWQGQKPVAGGANRTTRPSAARAYVPRTSRSRSATRDHSERSDAAERHQENQPGAARARGCPAPCMEPAARDYPGARALRRYVGAPVARPAPRRERWWPPSARLGGPRRGRAWRSSRTARGRPGAGRRPMGPADRQPSAPGPAPGWRRTWLAFLSGRRGRLGLRPPTPRQARGLVDPPAPDVEQLTS
jgi:hypothetical protein